MNNRKIIKQLIFFEIAIFYCLFFLLNPIFAVSDQVDIGLEVESSCGDGVCDLGYGETVSTCSVDCGCDNNGVCESDRGETYDNCPLDCGEEKPQPGGPKPIFDTIPPVIYNLSIDKISLKTIIISWDTNEPSVCKVFLGKTFEYKRESIVENTFYSRHSTKITGLLPETKYHFKVNCRDTNRNESETKDYQFITLTPPDIAPPANISGFSAVSGDKQISLRWHNPSDPDFKGVRIMRSEKFYPSDPWEGILIYDGKETSFTDEELMNGKRYYYTAFSYDKSGNYSSGAIVSEVPLGPLPSGKKPPIVVPPLPPEKIPPQKAPPLEIQKVKIDSFNFIQEGKKISLIESRLIRTKPEKPLTVSIDYQKVPEVLKTIMVTLEKNDKFFSFLLRVNKDKTAYSAAFFVPEEPGIYNLTITVLDYKNSSLKRIKGILSVEKLMTAFAEPKFSWFKKPFDWKWIIYLLSFLILLAVLVKYLGRKNRNKKIISKS